jgi:polyisoprenoid-binding protein YceI
MRNFLTVALLSTMTLMFSCKGKEQAVTTTDAGTAAVADTAAVAFNVDTTATKIMWEGSKPAGKHTGTLNVSNGTLSVQGGNITAGEFNIDMNSLMVTDLKGDEKAGLEGHLKGTKKGEEDHFFNVAKYPTAKFAVNKVTGLTGDSIATHLVYGNLTIKDVTKEVSFKANVNATADGVSVKTAPFMINRTDFNVKYGSKTFFDNLKDKFIDDNIAIQLDLTAKK